MLHSQALFSLPERKLTQHSNSKNVSVQHSKDRVNPKELNIKPNEDFPPAPIDGSIDKWFFISGAAV